eukprot:Amastigsp_a846781_8.p5 type:complete len:102 gc:universal Amastigsp_a846781_8:61-366(+)
MRRIAARTFRPVSAEIGTTGRVVRARSSGSRACANGPSLLLARTNAAFAVASPGLYASSSVCNTPSSSHGVLTNAASASLCATRAPGLRGSAPGANNCARG